ncbi:30S ribosomal protein S17 [Patescibacteria group bacterium]|nr:30S ribosomal protein S17 [Patescibacteria group bacterium]
MTIIGGKSIKELTGTVVSDKMDKTIVVVTKTVSQHPLYKKRFTVRKKYYAHDENNAAKIGDTVTIRQHNPVSKTKRRALVEVTAHAA